MLDLHLRQACSNGELKPITASRWPSPVPLPRVELRRQSVNKLGFEVAYTGKEVCFRVRGTFHRPFAGMIPLELPAAFSCASRSGKL